MSEKKGFFNALFGGKKSDCCNMKITEGKETTVQQDCDCGGNCDTNKSLEIKILGSGCKNCMNLTENTKAALSQMGIEAHIEKIEDVAKIASYGVMSTPALVVHNNVVSFGKVLKPQEIIDILTKLERG